MQANIITLVEMGYNDKQICQELNIGVATFYQWLDEKNSRYIEEFEESYKKAKELKHKLHIENLEYQTNKHIEGYFVEEVTTKIRIEDEGTPKEKVVKHIDKVKKWVTGNGTVLIHEKKNADPQRWNESINVNASVNVNGGILEMIRQGKVVVEGDEV